MDVAAEQNLASHGRLGSPGRFAPLRECRLPDLQGSRATPWGSVSTGDLSLRAVDANDAARAAARTATRLRWGAEAAREPRARRPASGYMKNRSEVILPSLT